MNRVTAICRTSVIHVQTFAFKRKRRNLPFAFNVRSTLAPRLILLVFQSKFPIRNCSSPHL
jgi:hypothetical protein